MNLEASEPAKPIAATLEAVAIRKHRSKFRRAGLLAAACTAAGLLVAVVIDWHAAWQLPATRWAGPLAVWGMAAILATRALKIHLDGPDKEAAALALDRSGKNSQQRWATFAALQPDGVGGTGSAPMAQALVREMAPMCRQFDPATVEPEPIPKRKLAIFAGASALLIAFLAVHFQEGSPRLLARFLLPWSELPLTRLDEASIPPGVLLSGSNLDVTAGIGGKRPAEVRLEMIGGTNTPGQPHQLAAPVPLQPGEPIAFTVERLRQPLRYRLSAGDAQTPWRDVNVTERPRLSVMTVTVTDPDYSERPPRVWKRAPSRVEAIRGSELTIQFEIDRAVKSAALEIAAAPGSGQMIPVEAMGEQRFQFRTGLDQDFVFRPEFESVEGFANAELPFSHIEVRDDRPPAVELGTDSASEVVSLHHDLTVSFEARDDVGIAEAEVVFSITDANGNTREAVVPIDLGEQRGGSDVSLKSELPLADLGLKADDKISYAVRVRDNFQQASSSGQDRMASAENAGTPPDSMTKRPLKIGGASGTSKPRQLRVAGHEMLNEIGPKKKKLLAIEAAFGQLRALTASALGHTAAAKAPDRVAGKKIDTAPLFRAVASARKDIDTATKGVTEIVAEAPGTPYEFLNLQLKTILGSYLAPAEAKLEGAVWSLLPELPPREAQRQLAEGLLTQALAKLDALEKTISQVRSQVEAEFAMAELMTMYVAQIEDMPILLGGGSSSPYQRSPGEIDRAQAEAALKRLESRKALYQKTAELLRQHPELWQRYMDKSKVESKIFRDELEALSNRHARVQALTAQSGNAEAAAGTRALIAAHQERIAAALLRSLEKARTWLPQDGNDPVWLSPLNSAALGALGASASEAIPAGDLRKSADVVSERIDAAAEALGKASVNARGNSSAGRSFALRLGELKQSRAEQDLVNELAAMLETRSWRQAALLEQANIARLTQQLAGKIEVESAGLTPLGKDVESLGATLAGMMQNQLMPALAESVSHLQKPAAIPDAQQAQETATRSYAECVRALDRFVMAAIREMDRAPAKAAAGVAGAPRHVADTLEELQRKLQEEAEIAESFGIPCCRPTNFQVMSDWQRPGSGQSGSKSGSPSPSSPSAGKPKLGSMAQAGKPSKSAGSNGQGEGKAESSASPSPNGKRSEMDVVSLTGLARAEALNQAQSLADQLTTKRPAKPQSGTPGKGQASSSSASSATAPGGGGAGEEESAAHGMGQGGADLWDTAGAARDWNRLGSKLRREILQERSEGLPDQYREAIEEYFRALSQWKSTANTPTE